MTISRRQFLGRSAMGVAAAGCLSAGALELGAEPLGMPIGFQIFPVREMFIKDFAGSLRQFAEIGYKTIEMCSPVGYEDSGFGPLTKFKGAEMRKIINDAGLRCESCHYQFDEFRKPEILGQRIAFAKELGLKQMILSSFDLPRTAKMDDWRKAADETNKAAETIRKAGMQAGFHNHNFEFKEFDGVLIYDELMRKFDPKLVKMQFQVAVISIGFDAATYLTKYPGRFISLHLADWSATEKKQVPVGKGVVDWKKVYAAAKTGGVKNHFVEMNFDAMKASYPYVRDLKV